VRTSRIAAWLWPTQPRHPEYATLRYCLRGFVLKTGVLLALASFLFICWYQSTQAWRPRDDRGSIIVVSKWCRENPHLCEAE
jgi:protein-S-isoprenylcysteine O-methyltransferase Ste14